jgi:hypothetical protein
MTHREELAEVALSYRKLGVGIVLMKVGEDGSKKTLVRWKTGGLRGSRSILDRLDRNDIDESAVLAVVTGSKLKGGGYLVGIDADTYRPGVQEALDRLNLPPTATSITPRGGKHLLFRYPKPFASFVRSDGIEVKAVGSLLTMPPGSGAYWLVDADRAMLDPFSIELAEMPDWVFEAATRKYDRATKYDATTHTRQPVNSNFETYVDLEGLCLRVRQLKPGNRRTGLLSISGYAFSLVRAGVLAERVTYQRLLESSVSTGVEPDEAERVLRWTLHHDKGRYESPWGALNTVVRKSELEVLRFVKHHLGGDFRRCDVLSARYIAGALGLGKSTVNDSLQSLLKRRLIWSGGAKRLKDGHRKANRYGISQLGLRLLEEAGH